MKIIISDIIKEERKRMGINQETLANQFGISIQAVSKWEQGLSCPDISLLPGIAEFFGVTIDYILTGKTIVASNDDADGETEVSPAAVYTVAGDGEIKEKCPKVDTLYVVEIYNGHIIEASNNIDDADEIQLNVPSGVWNLDVNCAAYLSFDMFKGNVNVHDGNASFNGEIVGNINAENCNFSCNDNVDGSIYAKDSSAYFNSDINGDVILTTGNVNCEDVNGNVVNQNGNITVGGDVNGEVTLKDGDLNCEGDINGDVEAADGDITIEGDVEGDIDVHYGNVNCEGDVAGDVEVADGNFSCEGEVAGDVSVTNGSFACEGDVSGDVNVSEGNFYCEGDVSGDVSCDGFDRSDNYDNMSIFPLRSKTIAKYRDGMINLIENRNGRLQLDFSYLPETNGDRPWILENGGYGVNVIYQCSREKVVFDLKGSGRYDVIVRDLDSSVGIDCPGECFYRDNVYTFVHERNKDITCTVYF